MRLISKLAVAGVGVVALSSGAALAQEMHVMKVALPDGSTAHIRYAGDTPPQVAVVPVRQVAVPIAWNRVDPFAQMDRVFADMNRQMAAMLQQANQLRAPELQAGAKLDSAALAKRPARALRYSYVSTTSNGGCTQSVQYISDGSAAQPKVISQSSGDCSAVNKPAIKASIPTTPAIPAASKPLDRNTI